MRKESIITLQDGDRVLTFAVKQMSAWDLERWIYRAAVQVARANGEDIAAKSIADAQRAVQSLSHDKGSAEGAAWIVKTIGGLDYEAAMPLLDELLNCCQLIPDASNPTMRLSLTKATVDGNISSPFTLTRLRVEAAKLNFSFFGAGPTTATAEEPAITIRKNTRTSRR